MQHTVHEVLVSRWLIDWLVDNSNTHAYAYLHTCLTAGELADLLQFPSDSADLVFELRDVRVEG